MHSQVEDTRRPRPPHQPRIKQLAPLLALLTTQLLTLGGCLGGRAVDCGNGLICAADMICDRAHEICVTAEQLEACNGSGDGDPCRVGNAGGTCDQGVCLLHACGNGTVDASEMCDDGNLVSGDGCSADCRSTEVCGNGVVDLGEGCDEGENNSDEPGAACRTNCLKNGCGDGILDAGEQCDGANLGGLTCETSNQGFDDGILACNNNCSLNYDACTGCGDGIVEGAELCDGTNLGGLDCATINLGFNSGTLLCGNDCRFIYNYCTYCGDQSCESHESFTTCPQDCGSLMVSIGASGGTCTAHSSGIAYCWRGLPFYYSSAPAPVTDATALTSISVGALFACATKSDGTVWCWGSNANSQLGSSAPAMSNVPLQVPGIADAIGVSAGGILDMGHACALLSDQSVTCWGYNGDRQLGDGTQQTRPEPMPVSPLPAVEEVIAGDTNTCARTLQGELYCWGTFQAVGGGNPWFSSSPSLITGLSDVISFASGMGHRCAVRTDGAVFCWGANFSGQLGNGNNTPSETPVQVIGLHDAIRVSAEAGTTCALRDAGIVSCWGGNGGGELGDGTTNSSSLPVNVSSLMDVGSIAVGNGYTCAVKRNSELWCWGSGDLVPVQVTF